MDAPLVVVDIGTAITFDVVEAGVGYRGGVIAPGPDLVTSYLSERTDVLPKVSLRKTDRFIGRHTEEAIQIAAHHGVLGCLREIVEGVRRELKVESLNLVGTGGYAEQYVSDLNCSVSVVPELTLQGIGHLAVLNPDKVGRLRK